MVSPETAAGISKHRGPDEVPDKDRCPKCGGRLKSKYNKIGRGERVSWDQCLSCGWESNKRSPGR